MQEDIELLEEEQNLLMYVDSVDHDIEGSELLSTSIARQETAIALSYRIRETP